MKRLADALAKSPLFSGFSKKELCKIEKISHIRYYRQDEVIYKKFSPAEGFYIILEGEVKAEKVFKIHEAFGTMSIIPDSIRMEDSFSKTRSILCFIFREHLFTLFRSYPDIAIRFYSNLLCLSSGRVHVIRR